MTETTTTANGDVSTADIEVIRGHLPLLERIADAQLKEAILVTWVRQWRKSAWEDPEDCPHSAKFEVGGNYSLFKHVNSGLRIAVVMADALIEDYGVDVDLDRLLAIGHLHDVSKLQELEPDAEGKARHSRVGETFPHAALGAVEAYEAGIDDMICKSIVMHPYHPPHTFVKPACLELLIYTWADHGAADPLTFVHGGLTHMEKRRLFEVAP
jgi:hypothetical protein